jgi:hypothetical protein
MSRLNAAISRVTAAMPHRATPRGPIGQTRKIAILGGASTIRFAPFDDMSWELWSHASCRDRCRRAPDLLFDLHPKDLWANPKKKAWDPGYLKWLKRNHIPIYMQERYAEVPASIRYPFETMITEFPRGYMTNQSAYMIALALMSGVTHLAVYGCHYQAKSEYWSQRGSMEYWLGVAEGRGVQVLIPPQCDLLNNPPLLYGYESHPDGKRHGSYDTHSRELTPGVKPTDAAAQDPTKTGPVDLLPLDDPKCPPLMKLDGVTPNPGRWGLT